MAEISVLAKRIDTMRTRLNDLWDATKSSKKRVEINGQLAALDKQVMRLISINIKSDGKEYEDATAALLAANKRLAEALEQEQAFAKAIEAVAGAVDKITSVLAAV